MLIGLFKLLNTVFLKAVNEQAKETPKEEGGKPNPTKAGIPPSLLRFLLCTPLPYPLTPTLPAFTVVLQFSFWLLYLTLFNLSHRRASHLWSGGKLASAFVRFVYLWGEGFTNAYHNLIMPFRNFLRFSREAALIDRLIHIICLKMQYFMLHAWFSQKCHIYMLL